MSLESREPFQKEVITEVETQIKSGNISIESLFETLKKVSSPYTKIFHSVLINPSLTPEQKFHNGLALRNQLLNDESIPWFEYKSNDNPKIGRSDEALFMKQAIEGLRRKERLKISIQQNQIAIEGETFSSEHT